MNIKKTLGLLLLGILVGGAGCKKDTNKGQGSLDLGFYARAGSQQVVLYQTWHPMPGGDTLNMQVLQFFVGELRLVNEAGDTVSVGQIELVDFARNHLTAATAPQGEHFSVSKVPAGRYNRIIMGIGIPPVVNAKEPGDFPSTSPLGDIGNYWTAWDSYIFSRAEGRMKSPSGTVQPFLYHSGVDGMYQVRSFDKNFEIQENQVFNLNFMLQITEIFAPSGGSPIDVFAQPSSHSGAVGTPDYNLAVEVVRNMADALKIQ